MKSSSLGLVAPGLLLLLLSGCGEEAGREAASPSSAAAPPNTPARSGAETAPAGALTPEELAAEPAAVPSDPAADGFGSDDQGSPETEGVETGAVTELDWDALIPAEWRPDKIMEQYAVDELEDDDPRAQELMKKLQALWNESPVVQDLDGRRVKLPGFIVPLDTDGQKIGEFLLVPYYGACIHVPPPPANQTVHVATKEGQEYPGELFDVVWVSGTLKVESSSSDLAEAGYRMDATKVEQYE